MNITLTPEQERYIQLQLEEGKYNSVEQLISEALQLLEERNRALEEKRLEELRQKIASGTEQIARGQVTDGEVAIAQLQEKIRLISESEVILTDDNPRREISQRVEDLFRQTQALPGVQDITEEDISAEIEALRLLEERDKQYEKWVEETREKVAVGIAQLDRGEGLDGEAVVASILERFKQARQNREGNE
jgi:antitoxin ParD1/3/4